MTMLLTLATTSLAARMKKKGNDQMSLLEVPDFAARELELRGLNVAASQLAGWSLEDLDQLRDRADKAGAPCLVLVDDTPLSFTGSAKAVAEAGERLRRVGVAANRLGCNAVAVQCEAPDTDDAFDRTAAGLKEAMPPVERLELNVLISPFAGLTYAPERLTELIKRIGGFRIGSLPTFEHAASTGNPVETLRRLAPYAGAIHATVKGFTRSGDHQDYDLTQCVYAVRSVGFVNTLSIEYIGKAKDPVPLIEKASQELREAMEVEEFELKTS